MTADFLSESVFRKERLVEYRTAPKGRGGQTGLTVHLRSTPVIVALFTTLVTVISLGMVRVDQTVRTPILARTLDRMSVLVPNGTRVVSGQRIQVEMAGHWKNAEVRVRETTTMPGNQRVIDLVAVDNQETTATAEPTVLLRTGSTNVIAALADRILP